MYMSIRTLDYVIFSHQANLFKTTKHWDGFVSHCTRRVYNWIFPSETGWEDCAKQLMQMGKNPLLLFF